MKEKINNNIKILKQGIEEFLDKITKPIDIPSQETKD